MPRQSSPHYLQLFLLFFLLGVLPPLSSPLRASPSDEVGHVFVRNISPKEYDGHGQNWQVLQDERGLIYVCNGRGVMEYDGISWRMIPIPNGSACRSVAMDSSGRIFVGAVSEIGYLAPDALGKMGYVSLLEHIPEEERDFTYVWRTHFFSGGVYYQTSRRILRWNGIEFKTWRAPTYFHLSYVIHDTFYVDQADGGLLRQEGDTLVPAPGGATFVENNIFGMLPQGTDGFLAITGNDGMFHCRGDTLPTARCNSMNPELIDLFQESNPFSAAVLPDGRLAIGTQHRGVILLAPDGQLLQILDESAGLADKSVLFLYVDRQGGLWLAQSNGLARMEVSSPLTFFSKSLGLPESTNSIGRHRGHLYAAAGLGVYRLQPATQGKSASFELIPNVSGQCWSLLPMEQGMMAACNAGVYNVDESRMAWRFPGQHAFTFHRSKRFPQQVFVGLQHGLARMEQHDGEWQVAEVISEVQNIRSIVEDPDGRFWLSPQPGEIVRLEWPTSSSGEPTITRFGAEHGLPTVWLDVKTLRDQLLFLSGGATEDGEHLFELESHGDSTKFVPSTVFDSFLPPHLITANWFEDEQGRIWLLTSEGPGVAYPNDEGEYTFSPTALRRVSNLNFESIYADEGGPLWVGGPDNLLRLETESPLTPPDEYPVWIRSITSGTTLLYGGEKSASFKSPAWPQQNEALRFAFAAPRYDAAEQTRYRSFLEGFDDEWSEWSDEPHRDFTNLWEGRYTFRVQARDAYGFLSRKEAFAFQILPPWYRSWWAYTLYLLAFFTALLSYGRHHQKQLERERAVNARLREVDKLKDEFLANTSHELRTPLHGMTGIVESLIDGATGELPEETKKNLAMVAASGRRLSHLVDDILDFSKLRHGSLELNRRPVDLRALVDVVLTLLTPLAQSKNLRLENKVGALPPAEADENRLQQILYNLIGNAIKFTEEGTVQISADVQDQDLTVHVTDTGLGIPEERQGNIFNAFEQADASIERDYGGTGLGLAVTRKLVDLHGGSIWVESSPGEGSTFSFTLPVAQDVTEVVAPHPVSELVLSPVEENLTLPEPAAGSPGAVRILVVDDEAVNRQVLMNFLALETFDLMVAPGGEEAIRLLEEQHFDLVLLDVMMPKISGYEVCRNLREKHSMSELPVLFLTARNRTTDVVEGLALGANDYLTKPISKRELLARIRPHLDLQGIHRNLEHLVEEKLSEIKVLEGLLPICAVCKRIRDEGGRWNDLETFIDVHSEAEFSHGICPDCTEEHYGPYYGSDHP